MFFCFRVDARSIGNNREMRAKGDNCGSYTFSIKIVICRIGLTSFDINVVLNIMAFEKRAVLPNIHKVTTLTVDMIIIPMVMTLAVVY